MQVNITNTNINVNNDDKLNTSTYKSVQQTSKSGATSSIFAGGDIFGINTVKTTAVTYSKNDTEEKAVMDNENIKEKLAEAVNSLMSMITPEGYNGLSELGIIPDEENPELSIGVYERIQMELATYCEDYVPTSLNINKEKLQEITGSAAFANAVEKAMDLKNMSEDSKACIVQSDEVPTIDNVYKEAHSSVGHNTMKKELSEDEMSSIIPQIEKMFEMAGIENNDTNMQIAKWMISYSIPLTPEKINKAIIIDKSLSLSTEEFETAIRENISYSMYFTGSEKCALFTKGQYDLESIKKCLETIHNVSDEAIYETVTTDKCLNVENLDNANHDKADENTDEVKLDTPKLLQAKKTILEARVVMTSTSLLKIQSLGVDIKSVAIDELVEEIENIQQKIAEEFLESVGANPTAENKELLLNTTIAVNGIRYASISMVAAVSVETDTLETVSKTALTYGITSYEKVGTEVRRDLGDSINKAFENVDNLLEQIGMEASEINRKAVRILGYNSMDVTVENVEKMAEAANEIEYLVKNLTPKAASYLISNNINPMDTDIKTLNKQLEQINQELNITTVENFAEYLWKLDKTDGISTEDRKKFIEIYRTLNKITEKDSRSLGAAISSGYELTMENLLAAAKSRNISAEVVKKFIDSDESNEYELFKISKLQENVVSEEEVTELISNNIPVTPKNMKNVKELKTNGKVLEKLYENSPESVKKLLLKIEENIGDEMGLKEAYEKLSEEQQVVIKDEMSSISPTYGNIEAVLANNGMIDLMKKLSKNESYYVPVEINGSITNVHLTVISGTEESSLTVNMKESLLGEINLQMNIETDTESNKVKLQGMLIFKDSGMKEKAEKLASDYTNELSKNNINVSSITVINSMSYKSKLQNSAEKGETSVLFKCAKLFINTIKTYGNE